MTDELERLSTEYASHRERFAGRDIYSPFNPGHLFITHQRQKAMLELMRQSGLYPLENRRILEIGCGQGPILREFISFGADPRMLHGIDLLYDDLISAQALSPHLAFFHADGRKLPYATGTFDLVLQFTVFTSVLDPTIKRDLATEMRRVMKPGGIIMWYDYWLNPTNPQTQGIRPAEIRDLFPDCDYTFRRITLAPPISRQLSKVSWLLCYLLEQFTIFNTHYLVAIRKSLPD